MSEQTKKGIFDKDYSRRQFLKMSGKGIAGITMTGAMLSLFGCSQEDVDAGKVEILATPTGLLVANAAKCVGCQRCELNCSLTHDKKASHALARLNIRDNLYVGEYNAEDGIPEDVVHGQGLYGLWGFAPTTCKQCKEPGCAAACPVGAIVADETTGTRIIESETCIGCGACTAGCPWNLPTVDKDTGKSTKCINCGACVAGCPTGAIAMVEWTDVVTAL